MSFGVFGMQFICCWKWHSDKIKAVANELVMVVMCDDGVDCGDDDGGLCVEAKRHNLHTA